MAQQGSSPSNIIHPESRAPGAAGSGNTARPMRQHERTQREGASRDADTEALGRPLATHRPWQEVMPHQQQSRTMRESKLRTLAFGTVPSARKQLEGGATSLQAEFCRHFGKAEAQLMDMYAAKQLLYILSDVLPTSAVAHTPANDKSAAQAQGEANLSSIRGGEARNVAVECLPQATKRTEEALTACSTTALRAPCRSNLHNRASARQARAAACRDNAPATRKSAMVIGCRMAPKQL